jgi:tetratricopeptide (TPR) repeat protein
MSFSELTVRVACALAPLLLLSACGILSNRYRAGSLLSEAVGYTRAGDFPSAAASAQAARDLDPDMVSAYVLAAQALAASGSGDKAEAELELALKAVKDQGRLVDVVLLLADRKLSRGDVSGALALISKHNDDIGGQPDLLLMEARLLNVQGHPEQALLSIDEARSLADLGPDGLVLWALILARLDRPEEGAKVLVPLARQDAGREKWSRRPPDLSSAMQFFIQTGETQGLTKLLERLNQDVPDTRFIRLDLSRAYISEQKTTQALDLLDSFVTETDAEGQFLRGVALGELGRLEDAVKAFEMALAAAPEQARPRLLANLANMHLRLGNPSLAVAEYGNALDINPGQLDALDGLIQVARTYPSIVDEATLRHRIENALMVIRDPEIRKQLQSALGKN